MKEHEELTPDLSGDMGVSSERTAGGRTSGTAPTHPDEEIPTPTTTTPGVPDDELTENPASVPEHPFDPARNPGHSHG